MSNRYNRFPTGLTPQSHSSDPIHYKKSEIPTSKLADPATSFTLLPSVNEFQTSLRSKTSSSTASNYTSRFQKNSQAKQNSKFDVQAYRLNKLYQGLKDSKTWHGRGPQPGQASNLTPKHEVQQNLLKKKEEQLVNSLVSQVKFDQEITNFKNHQNLNRHQIFNHDKQFQKNVMHAFDKHGKLGSVQPIAKHKKKIIGQDIGPSLYEKLENSVGKTESIGYIQKSILAKQNSLINDTFQTSTTASLMPGRKGRSSHSFHSFTQENQTWEEHLLTNLSKFTAEWLVLERSNTKEDRAKLAKLMDFDEGRKDVQLVNDIVKCKELEILR